MVLLLPLVMVTLGWMFAGPVEVWGWTHSRTPRRAAAFRPGGGRADITAARTKGASKYEQDPHGKEKAHQNMNKSPMGKKRAPFPPMGRKGAIKI